MFAIISRDDGFPICRRLPGVSPDPVVTWESEDAARAFITSKGSDADFQAVQLTDAAMDRMAAAMGCALEAITFDPYPAA